MAIGKGEQAVGNVTDGPFPASRGPRLPEMLSEDSPAERMHKLRIRAKMEADAADEQAKQLLRRAVADSVRAKLGAFTAPESEYLLAMLDGPASSGVPSNVRGTLRDAGLP